MKSPALLTAAVVLQVLQVPAVSGQTPPPYTPQTKYTPPSFPILPFTQYEGNPIITANPDNVWESAYTYNPTAIASDDYVYLLYRAQPTNLTSSIGLAWSSDGYNFTRMSEPVIYATEDYESEGGTEDPRIVNVNGTFYVTYTGYDKPTNLPKLCIASSTDLLNWTKYGPVFPSLGHSKSAAIIPEMLTDGNYHMFFNDSKFVHATSPNMLNWTIVLDPFAGPTDEGWEDYIIEPGGAPVKTNASQWLLVYNGVANGSDPSYADIQYSSGQMLLDPVNHPSGPVDRLTQPFLTVDGYPLEEVGQTPNVIFSEGLVQFKGQWFVYFGMADSRVGVATSPVT